MDDLIDKILQHSTIAIAVTLVLVLLQKASARRAVDHGDGMYTLHLPRSLTVLSIVYLLMGVTLLVGLTSEVTSWKEFRWFLLGALLLCAFPSAIILLYSINHKVRFNAGTIEVKSPWGKATEVRWEDLRQGEFRPLSGMLHLSTEDGRTVKISPYMVGFKDLLTELRKWPQCELNIKRLPL